MEKNISCFDALVEIVTSEIVAEYKRKLAEAKEGEKVTSAWKKFNIIEVLRRHCGAERATASIRIAKNYTWLSVNASRDGFYDINDFSQRRQATAEEMKVAEELAGKSLSEVICVGGVFIDENQVPHLSMKWDELFYVDADGVERGFAFSGPVRHYDAETGTFDGPVVEETAENEEVEI